MQVSGESIGGFRLQGFLKWGGGGGVPAWQPGNNGSYATACSIYSMYNIYVYYML